MVVEEAKQRVVVGIDGSKGVWLALEWALVEAARRGAQLEVVTAFPVDFYWTDPYLLDSRRIDLIQEDTEARAWAVVDMARQQVSGAASYRSSQSVTPRLRPRAGAQAD